jgi:hypothetical protein
MAEIRIIDLKTDPATARIMTAALQVTFNGDTASVATILLSPSQSLPRTEHGLREHLRQLAEVLLEAPLSPLPSPSIPEDQQKK